MSGPQRCGRCLVRVPPATFMHDCAGKGLEADHYVSRLEGQLERLGVWLTQNGFDPQGREDCVAATVRFLGAKPERKVTICQDCDGPPEGSILGIMIVQRHGSGSVRLGIVHREKCPNASAEGDPERNADGLTPAEEKAARLAAGRCGECGSGDGHYRDCSRHRHNKF